MLPSLMGQCTSRIILRPMFSPMQHANRIAINIKRSLSHIVLAPLALWITATHCLLKYHHPGDVRILTTEIIRLMINAANTQRSEVNQVGDNSIPEWGNIHIRFTELWYFLFLLSMSGASDKVWDKSMAMIVLSLVLSPWVSFAQ